MKYKKNLTVGDEYPIQELLKFNPNNYFVYYRRNTIYSINFN